MAEAARRFEASSYLDRSFAPQGIGGWRALYLKFVADLRPESLLEVGAGTPDFLERAGVERRVAVDVGERFAADFRARGIEFVVRDLDREGLEGVAPVDVAVCSDVFEHLLDPAGALDALAGVLRPGGILFSHVPNEFRLGHLARVMLGRREAVAFHPGSREWDDPHLRRFTDRGFRAFLSRRFEHNLKLTDLGYGGSARRLQRLGAPVPFCLEGGPTYASTRDPETFGRLSALKEKLARER